MAEKLSASQEKLHQKFLDHGRKHLESRQSCIGLLPQIFAEKIYVKKGFDSIFEYAAKLAGLSHEQVKRALSLHARFQDKPVLGALLVSGEVSLNKLAKIASVATMENEAALADQIRLLPCRAVETLVRDLRWEEKNGVGEMLPNDSRNQNGLQKPLFAPNFVHVNKIEPQSKNSEANPFELLKLRLNPENVRKLVELQNKGIEVNEMIDEMLKTRELSIVKEKAGLADSSGSAKSRYIKVAIRKVLAREYGDKCSVPYCVRPAETLHHTGRLALVKTHNPHFLASLCREHHRIAHSIDLKYQEFSGQNLCH